MMTASTPWPTRIETKAAAISKDEERVLQLSDQDPKRSGTMTEDGVWPTLPKTDQRLGRAQACLGAAKQAKDDRRFGQAASFNSTASQES
jgi:hypothetical protein